MPCSAENYSLEVGHCHVATSLTPTGLVPLGLLSVHLNAEQWDQDVALKPWLRPGEERRLLPHGRVRVSAPPEASQSVGAGRALQHIRTRRPCRDTECIVEKVREVSRRLVRRVACGSERW